MAMRVNGAISNGGAKTFVPVEAIPNGVSDGLYKLITAEKLVMATVTTQAEGKIPVSIPGGGNGFMLKYILVQSLSVNFNVKLYLDAAEAWDTGEGNAGNNLTWTKVFTGNGLPYYDKDETGKIHLNCDDVPGADTFDITIIGSVA